MGYAMYDQFNDTNQPSDFLSRSYPASTPNDEILARLSEALAAFTVKRLTPEAARLVRRQQREVFQAQALAALTSISDLVEQVFRLQPGELRSQSKTQHLALGRQVAMYLCRTVGQQSFTIIGDHLNRDHSTVIHGVNLIQRRIMREPKFRLFIKKLAGQVTNPAIAKAA
jgi:chromosomal replication initiator protein